jgi:hypothetical protein
VKTTVEDEDSLDDRIRAYYELQGCALSMTEGEAFAYAPKCETCRRPERNKETAEVVGRKLGPLGYQVCRKCGALWPYVTVVLPRGDYQKSGRPQGYENKLAGLAPLGYELNRMLRDDHWRWATQVLVGYATTSNGFDDIADHANRFSWPHPRGGVWNEARCRAACVGARRELRARMKAGQGVPG